MMSSSLLSLLFGYLLCNSLLVGGNANRYYSSQAVPYKQQTNQYYGYNNEGGSDDTYGNDNYDKNTNKYSTNNNDNYNNYGDNNNYGSNDYNAKSYDNYNGNNNNNDYNSDYTPTKDNYEAIKFKEEYTPSNDLVPPGGSIDDSSMPSFTTGTISGSKHSHGRLDVRGKMAGVGHQDYGVNYLSLTKFRKGGGYDIYGKKRQFLDYDTQGHVKKYGNQHMRTKFEVVGNLNGYSTYKQKSSFTPPSGGYSSKRGRRSY
uniref:Eggshell protein, chorion n=1 Tax=Schistosoma japonicum TaxID=6182 RepID=Q76N11_SCHJA|nr:eggshell protein, chorion [Schistosoma japonicum]BAD06411.1 eggshell protein, chorion [Schistosoma japonicum]